MTVHKFEEASSEDAIGIVDGDVISIPLEMISDGEGACVPIVCCDCGLAHDFEYRIRGGRLEIEVARNDEVTELRLHKSRTNGLMEGVLKR